MLELNSIETYDRNDVGILLLRLSPIPVLVYMALLPCLKLDIELETKAEVGFVPDDAGPDAVLGIETPKEVGIEVDSGSKVVRGIDDEVVLSHSDARLDVSCRSSDPRIAPSRIGS